MGLQLGRFVVCIILLDVCLIHGMHSVSRIGKSRLDVCVSGNLTSLSKTFSRCANIGVMWSMNVLFLKHFVVDCQNVLTNLVYFDKLKYGERKLICV